MFEDGSIFNQLLVERLNYFIYVVLLLIGLWAMIAKNNLIKKLIGMSIFQTAIILFYVSIGVKEGATIPIYLPEHDPHGTHLSKELNATDSLASGPQVLDSSFVPGYTNPLPHVLMLTAIVVGVATLGLALSVCLRIYRGYGTAEEDELLEKLEREDARSSTGRNRRRPRRRRPVRKPAEGGQSQRSATIEKSKTGNPKTGPVQAGAKKTTPGNSKKRSQKNDNSESPKPKRARRTRQSSPRKPREDRS